VSRKRGVCRGRMMPRKLSVSLEKCCAAKIKDWKLLEVCLPCGLKIVLSWSDAGQSRRRNAIIGEVMPGGSSISRGKMLPTGDRTCSPDLVPGTRFLAESRQREGLRSAVLHLVGRCCSTGNRTCFPRQVSPESHTVMFGNAISRILIVSRGESV